MFTHVIFYDFNNRIHYLINLTAIGCDILFALKLIVNHTKHNVGVEDVVLKTAKADFITKSAFCVKIINPRTWYIREFNWQYVFVGRVQNSVLKIRS